MPEFRALTRAIRGVEPWKETLSRYVDDIFHTNFYWPTALKRLRSLYLVDGKYYKFRDVKLPLLSESEEELLFRTIYEDTFFSHLHCNDQYDEKTFDECDKFLLEGL